MKHFVVVVAGMAVAGAVTGAVWTWLAPSAHGVVALKRSGERVFAYLGDEADHVFVAPAMMVGLLFGVAIVIAALVWQWRQRRGPAMALALIVGGLACAGGALGVGAGVVRLRYGAIDIAGAPVTPEQRIEYVIQAPPVLFGHTPLVVIATVLLPAALAALTYGMLAAASARDDLGAGDLGTGPLVPETVA